LNPNQFDYGKYLLQKSILAQTFVDHSHVKTHDSLIRDAFFYADLIRATILKNLKKRNFNTKELNILMALLLGQQQDIAPEIVCDYQFAGAVHILSVSGLHVGFVLLFLNFILQWIPNSKRNSYYKLAVTLFALWGFAVLAGLSPSVIRSVTMFSFVAIGLHLKRQTNIYHTLLVSLFLILLFEPSFLFDIGFQLSYVALFSILWMQPLLNAIWQPKNKIILYFWQIITVSFAAQIGTLPLSLYYFHQFSGLFFITNVIVIPFLSVIMAMGIVVMLLASVDFIPKFLAVSLEWLIAILNKIIGSIASLEQFVLKDIPLNAILLWSLYFVIVALVFCFKKASFQRIAIVLIAILLLQASYFGSLWKAQHQEEWIVFNVKRATLIVERNGSDVAVFTNADFRKNNVLQSYLTANFCKIDTVKTIANLAYFRNKKILIIDSLGNYPRANPDVMLLRDSPKINLDRVFKTCKPKVIVADASNYKSYVALWKATCLKEKIPFHHTNEKGFYNLKD
jgi:competence protein ComEC